jgi:hypothetical protein
MAPIGIDREVTFPVGSGPTDGRVGTLNDLADLLATASPRCTTMTAVMTSSP